MGLRYAIGGLAGGEEKDAFWRVVAQCTAGLPEDKPRYVMVCTNSMVVWSTEMIINSTLVIADDFDLSGIHFPLSTLEFFLKLR